MIKIEVKLLVLHHMMIQVHGAIFAFPTGRPCIKKIVFDFLEKVKERRKVSVFEVSKVQKIMCIVWKTAKGQESFVVAVPDVYLLTFYFTLQSSSCHYILVGFQRMFGHKSTISKHFIERKFLSFSKSN